MRGEASTSSWLTYVFIGALIFGFGYARAMWVTARSDYKTTKARIKPLRKAMWAAIVKAIQLGALVVVVGIILTAWVIHDAAPK